MLFSLAAAVAVKYYSWEGSIFYPKYFSRTSLSMNPFIFTLHNGLKQKCGLRVLRQIQDFLSAVSRCAGQDPISRHGAVDRVPLTTLFVFVGSPKLAEDKARSPGCPLGGCRTRALIH